MNDLDSPVSAGALSLVRVHGECHCQRRLGQRRRPISMGQARPLLPTHPEAGIPPGLSVVSPPPATSPLPHPTNLPAPPLRLKF